MTRAWQAVERSLRGPAVSRLLPKLDIDARRYWLLMDLFGQLSERRELLSQLGRDGMSLQKASWSYYILSGLMALLFVAGGAPLTIYSSVFAAFTVFLLLAMLLAETSNSLVNPVEALVLAHQPINGATYAAAKLTHLLRLLLHMVPGLCLIPAVAGLLLKGCPWFYPLLFLAAGFVLGLVVALSCCALFGWLIRLVPAPRLRAAGVIAESLPWMVYLAFQLGRNRLAHLHVPEWLPSGAGPRAWLTAGVGAIAVTAGVFGIRSLSADYLVRVTAIAHGRGGAKSKWRRSRLSDLVARVGGGPAARAGFEYLSRMMARDWQFRRQLIQFVPLPAMAVMAAVQGARISPFSGKFTMMHVFPHVFGIGFYLLCKMIAFGNDHQSVWMFLLAPAGAFRGVARGIYARLFTLILAPHLVLLGFVLFYWGVRDGALFAIYSVAVASVYLGLELRLIEGMPFTRQPESAQNMAALPTMMLGVLVIGIAVAFQFLLFRSATAVILTTLVLCGAAWFATRSSLGALETSIRFYLGIASTEGKRFYTEVEA